MAQQHLYGTTYTQLSPPTEWQETSMLSTINDSLLESGIDEQELTFEGEAGEFLMTWMNTAGKGTFNGCPYRIIYTSNNNLALSNVRFDGYIDLFNATIMSESNPVIIKAPIKRIDNPKSVIEQMYVITQGLLVQKGFLNNSHYNDCPVIRESKKNIVDRIITLGTFALQVTQTFLQLVNNLLSAISGILGISIIVGAIELLVTFLNAAVMISALTIQGKKLKDLIWSPVSFYKTASFKTILTQAYAYKGYTVNFGTADVWLSKTNIMASQNEFDGYPIQGFPATGALKREDYGYIVGHIQETLAEMLNLRFRVIGNVVHIRPKSDPFWFSSPSYTYDGTLIKSAGYHQNGVTKYATDEVKATVIFNYAYDESDTHTLTEKSGDSFEIHRELIVELNPKMNGLKGIQEVSIPWAMAVRKKPFDNLWDLFTGISSDFDILLDKFKARITEFTTEIATSGVNVFAPMIEIFGATGLDTFLENRTGTLKIDDNAFALPKVIWLDSTDIGLRIPENFKDFIGAKALYDDWNKWDSPADVSGFYGQKRNYLGVSLRWAYDKFLQVENNPFFDLYGFNAKFTSIDWIEAKHNAVTDIQQRKPFDTNLTEIEV